MPLILAPYTMGALYEGAAAQAGGGAFVQRRRRWIAMAFCLVVMLCL